MTYEEACSKARAVLAGMSSYWGSASCDQIKAEICRNSTLFVGNDPVRLALCGGGGTPSPSPNPSPTPTPQGGANDSLSEISDWISHNPLWAVAIALIAGKMLFGGRRW